MRHGGPDTLLVILADPLEDVCDREVEADEGPELDVQAEGPAVRVESWGVGPGPSGREGDPRDEEHVEGGTGHEGQVPGADGAAGREDEGEGEGVDVAEAEQPWFSAGFPGCRLRSDHPGVALGLLLLLPVLLLPGEGDVLVRTDTARHFSLLRVLLLTISPFSSTAICVIMFFPGGDNDRVLGFIISRRGVKKGDTCPRLRWLWSVDKDKMTWQVSGLETLQSLAVM